MLTASDRPSLPGPPKHVVRALLRDVAGSVGTTSGYGYGYGYGSGCGYHLFGFSFRTVQAVAAGLAMQRAWKSFAHGYTSNIR